MSSACLSSEPRARVYAPRLCFQIVLVSSSSAYSANNVLLLLLFLIKGNQILSGLSIEEYKTVLKIIKQAILATDLAVYIK